MPSKVAAAMWRWILATGLGRVFEARRVICRLQAGWSGVGHRSLTAMERGASGPSCLPRPLELPLISPPTTPVLQIKLPVS